MISARAAALGIAAAAAAAALGAAPAPSQPPLPPPPQLRTPVPPGLHAGGETKCEGCHTTEQWGDVAFAHERTGFPLVGEHKKVGCKQCHPQSFSRLLSHDCSSCHRDVHRGQLGFRCQGCHDETSWRSRFDADAHRRVGFPLNGRHAFIPCEECHGDKLNRGFARPASQCIDCHQKNLMRGNAVLDHSGFGPNCKECHSTWRFANAYFPAHQTCFDIAGGPHAGIPCLSCHTSLSGARATGTCSTFTAHCTGCHTHSVAETDPKHTGVPGYVYADRKCWECHAFSGFFGTTRGLMRSRR